MSVYWVEAKKRWRYSFNRRIDGFRYRATKLLPPGWSQRQAEIYDQTHSGRYYAQATGVEKRHLTLAGAVQLYLDHRCPKLKNGKKAAQDLLHLIDEIERTPLDQVCDLAHRYAAANEGKLAPGTIRNRLSYLKAAVRYARRKHKYGDRDYTDGMDLPVPDNQRQVYARLPELNKLWRALKDPEARALFKLDFYLGLRWRAELLTREAKHVVKNDGDVWLEIGRTKNGLPVMKFVHPAVRSSLKFLPFTHGDQWFYARWRAATASIGRSDLRPHDLRHSLASEVLSRPGGTLDDVRAALHHKSLQAANRYAHRYPESAKAVLMGIGGGPNRAHLKRRPRKSAGKK